MASLSERLAQCLCDQTCAGEYLNSIKHTIPEEVLWIEAAERWYPAAIQSLEQHAIVLENAMDSGQDVEQFVCEKFESLKILAGSLFYITRKHRNTMVPVPPKIKLNFSHPKNELIWAADPWVRRLGRALPEVPPFLTMFDCDHDEQCVHQA